MFLTLLGIDSITAPNIQGYQIGTLILGTTHMFLQGLLEMPARLDQKRAPDSTIELDLGFRFRV